MHGTDPLDAQWNALRPLVQQLVEELHPRRRIDVVRSSRLDRDLGIDSLSRAELFFRIEQAFHVRLPERMLNEADTVADLLAAISRPSSGVVTVDKSVVLTELPTTGAAESSRTLTQVLDWHVAQHPGRQHLVFLKNGIEPIPMTYGELAQSARKIATGLIERGIAPSDRVAIMLPTCPEFFSSFFGVLYAGAIPVPIYPPARASQFEEHIDRQSGILRNAGATLLVTTEMGLNISALMRAKVPTLRAVECTSSLLSNATVSLPATADESCTALLQYTSGSTGDPKGVILSHANLLANIRAMGKAMNASSADVFASWLPLYHDMGLIGAWLGSLYFGASFYVMSPIAFLAHPENWLWAVHRYRATISAAPNFAFEVCRSKINDAEIEGLDLSSLRLIANGAEPVSAQSIRRFTERFVRYGFKPEAMSPAYGLAENAVGLTLSPLGRGPQIDRVDREFFAKTSIARPALESDCNPLEFVGCGHVLPDHEVQIVDDDGHKVPERVAGRLEFRGPSATTGYFENPEKTRKLSRQGWLDTGDQAYSADGEIFITGRVKDIVIRAGRHIYPQEVEETIGDLPHAIKGGVVLFGTADAATATERVVIAIETVESDLSAREELQESAHTTASSILGAPADEVLLLAPNAIPKTASGKIRRSAAKELYESGKLGAGQRSISRQRAHLALAVIAMRVFQTLKTLSDTFYGVWWWLSIALVASLAFITVMVLPTLELRWMAVRWVCRLGLILTGHGPIPGKVPSASNRPCVFVFNHASYADALVVGATLPGAPIFAAKKEFQTQIFAGTLLKRLGVAFVERNEISESLADTEKLRNLAKSNRRLAVFPEGTFSGKTGLAAFHLGAFKIASETGLPIVPGVINGTRTMLRGDQWWPLWAHVSVAFGDPIYPSGNDFASALELRNKARDFIAQNCAEPDLESEKEYGPL